MKVSVLSLALAAGLATAQTISQLPKCTQKCLQPFVSGTEIAGCKQLQIGCVCKNADFISKVACCLEDECDKQSQNDALAYAKKICATDGVETPSSIEGVCKRDSSSSSNSATASPSASGSASAAASPSASKADSSSSVSQSAAQTSETAKSDAAAGLGSVGILGGLVGMLVAL